jgi:DNA-binding MarR family transcriptional regulator/predicted N-acetyltransferase YhbS
MRRFDRFYVRTIGALREGVLDSPYSPSEARVILELAQLGETTATTLREALGLDAGYLSRLLTRLQQSGVVERRRSGDDGRRWLLSLTADGEAAFVQLDRQAEEKFQKVLADLAPSTRLRLTEVMASLEDALAPRSTVRATRTLVLRLPRPGDYGWIVYRHGVLHARQYGWDEAFEASVARTVADYAERHDPYRDRAWIAEVDGEPVGSIFCVDAGDGAAELRLLLVEPSARELGISCRLVDESVRFACAVGYREVVLRAKGVPVDAQRTFQHAGFELVSEDHAERIGKHPADEAWRLTLDPRRCDRVEHG